MRNAALTVVKVGGSIAAIPEALDRVCDAVARAGQTHRLVIVPGGGPFAEAVREFDRRMGLSPDAAHWMAVLAMDQYAHVLAARIPGARLVQEPGGIGAVLNGSGVAVLAPSRWMRCADLLPHSWEVTSDSVAAIVAGVLDAAQLVLIKPAANLRDPVDPYFSTALPAGLPYTLMEYDRIEELAAYLASRPLAANNRRR